jgi:hypothetical protein
MQRTRRMPGTRIARVQQSGIDPVAVGVADFEPAVGAGGDGQGVLVAGDRRRNRRCR